MTHKLLPNSLITQYQNFPLSPDKPNLNTCALTRNTSNTQTAENNEYRSAKPCVLHPFTGLLKPLLRLQGAMKSSPCPMLWLLAEELSGVSVS